MLELQIALASLGINGGPIDGILGQQTADALRTFQRRSRLAVTGRPDPTTYRALTLTRNPFARTVVSEADVRSLVQIPDTWAGKSMLSSMGFESILEALSERSHSHPNLVRRLNPHVDWSRIVPGMEVLLPNPVEAVPRRAARIQISILSRHLQVVDEMGLIVAHFPCSVGQIASRRPVGELRVTVIVKDPNYTFDPSVFPESKEGRMLARRLLLKPGPNNPVGTTWIGLDKPGFGIHGTPHPEKVGRSESHGCFRLANWNADQLRRMAWVGLPVSISEAD